MWRVGVDGFVIAVAALYGRVISIARPLGAYRYHDRNHSETSGQTLVKSAAISSTKSIARRLSGSMRRGSGSLSVTGCRCASPATARGVSSRRSWSSRSPIPWRPADRPCPCRDWRVLALSAPQHCKAHRCIPRFRSAASCPRSLLARNLEMIIVARQRALLLQFLLRNRPRRGVSIPLPRSAPPN
jgi:hypothetical protein